MEVEFSQDQHQGRVPVVKMDDVTDHSFAEKIGDSEQAIYALKQDKKIKTDRYFLIGHSSGGIISLDIAARNPWISGVILLATPANPLKDIIIEQTQHLLKLNNIDETEIETILSNQNEFFSLVEQYNSQSIIPEKYKPLQFNIIWLNQAFKRVPLKIAENLKCPILVLQGKKDLQVNHRESKLFDELFKRKSDPLNQVYVLEGLDHLFMESDDGNIGRYFDDSRTL